MPDRVTTQISYWWSAAVAAAGAITLNDMALIVGMAGVIVTAAVNAWAQRAKVRATQDMAQAVRDGKAHVVLDDD